MTVIPTTPTRLGGIIAAQKQAAEPAPRMSALARLLANGPRGEVVELPVLGKVRLNLIGCGAAQDVEAAVYRTMRELEITLDFTTEGIFELERARRVLAIAAVDPDTKEPLGTLDQWREMPSDVIGPTWQIYGDVRERLSPTRHPLSDEDRTAIATAIRTKNGPLLMAFGAAKLAEYAATTEFPNLAEPPRG